MITLANELGDFRCDSGAATLSLAILLIYVSNIVGYLIISIFGDFVGRKKIIIAGIIITIVGIIWTLLSDSLFLAATGLFFGLMGVQWAFSISFIFISETVAESMREEFLVIVQFFYGLGNLGNIGLFYWLRNWRQALIYWYIIPSVILAVAILFFVVDTPMCIIRNNSVEEVYSQLLWIAKVNGVNEP